MRLYAALGTAGERTITAIGEWLAAAAHDPLPFAVPRVRVCLVSMRRMARLKDGLLG